MKEDDRSRLVEVLFAVQEIIYSSYKEEQSEVERCKKGYNENLYRD